MSFICKMSQTYLLDWIPQINSTAVECFTAKRYDCHRLETNFTDKKFAPGPKPHSSVVASLPWGYDASFVNHVNLKFI